MLGEAKRERGGDNRISGGKLAKIRARFGAAQRIWVMNRGVPSEAMHQLDLTLPPQPPPKIRAPKTEAW